MALMHTPGADLGAQAPAFSLRGTDGKTHTPDSIAGKNGTLVMFICNHCPYVKAIVARLVDDMKKLQAAGIGIVAIMPNDAARYPDDSFDNMKTFAATHGDFFGYDAKGKLQYRGRLDEVNPSRPAAPDTRHELLEAMLEMAQTGKISAQQAPSMGCSIKWKERDAA